MYLVENFEELYLSYFANCVFNAILSYAAIMLNIVTIQALRKTASLPTVLRTLLLNCLLKMTIIIFVSL